MFWPHIASETGDAQFSSLSRKSDEMELYVIQTADVAGGNAEFEIVETSILV